MDLTDDQQREIASVVPGANLAGKWGWDDRTKRAHELVARLIREAKDEAWDEGYYYATNGKWGPPEDGANPYRD